MKQVVLEPRTGRVSVEDVPAPSPTADHLLVRTEVSVLSPGTEGQLIQLSSRSTLSKARARPDAVKQVVETMRHEGVRSAMWKAQARLEHPFPLGYSLAGIVLELGKGVDAPPPGTRVACGGGLLAVHAEIVSIPPLLAVPVPDGVSQEQAAFAYVGAIALHAVRLGEVGPGGIACVVGLGLIGQLAVQILSASGVHAVGVDPDLARRDLAASLSACDIAEDVRRAVPICHGRGGADVVLVTAAGSDADLVDRAVDLARDRGRIVVVGSVPISVDRDRMYRKELSLVVARSAGPGRYESSYEEHGVDMPAGHVRWTEGRNMAAFLNLVRGRSLAVTELVTHRFPIAEAKRAYEMMKSGDERRLGILLRYGHLADAATSLDLAVTRRASRAVAHPSVGVIGAGTFARSVLLPRLRRLDVRFACIATATGASAARSAKRFGFERATTDANSVIDDQDADAVLIATRHDVHAELAAAALSAGKHVYLEKPLSLDREGIDLVCRAWREGGSILSVGFNRRFAPLLRRLSGELGGKDPISAAYVVNVAPPAADSWVLDPNEGGGVVLAEGGHFIDVLTFLAGSPPVEVAAVPAGEHSYQASLRFLDGSVASIMYSTGALGRGPKELLTVVGRGVLATLSDFRSLSIWAGARKRTSRSKQDKGHEGAIRAWVEAIKEGKIQPVAMSDIVAVSEATICVHEALRTGAPVAVRPDRYADALGGARI
jgi:polar amino acid transport system substrate-binding protein